MPVALRATTTQQATSRVLTSVALHGYMELGGMKEYSWNRCSRDQQAEPAGLMWSRHNNTGFHQLMTTVHTPLPTVLATVSHNTAGSLLPRFLSSSVQSLCLECGLSKQSLSHPRLVCPVVLSCSVQFLCLERGLSTRSLSHPRHPSLTLDSCGVYSLMLCSLPFANSICHTSACNRCYTPWRGRGWLLL